MNGIYRFGEFRLDSGRRLLSRNGDPVVLTPKAFDLLLTLLDSRNQLLSKDELLEKVWPETFVEEGILKYNVSVLRKAFGGESWIETQPRRGYRFAGDVVRETAVEIALAEKTEVAVEVEAEITGPFRAWHWIAAGVALVAVAAGLVLWSRAGADTGVHTMAVLPLQSLSAAASDREMELGLTDSLITRLGAEGPWLVRPTGAVRSFSGGDRDPVAAGRKLDVDAVMDGSLQRSDNRLRLTLQLLRVHDGKHLWTGKFDQKLTDLFALEDRIAADVAQALSVKLRPSEGRRTSSDPEVYEEYLEGRHYFIESTPAATQRAIQSLEAALQREPGFAPACGMLALSYWQLAQRGGARTADVQEKLRVAANKAVELDPSNAEGHTALSVAKMWLDYDWDGAKNEYEQALHLNPHQPLVHAAWGIHALSNGRFEETERAYIAELEIHPQSVMSTLGRGYPLLYQGRFDEAITWYRKALEIDPAFPVAYNDLALAYNFKHMDKEYVEATLKQASLTGAPAEEISRRLEIFRREGVDGFRRDALNSALERENHGGLVSPVLIAGYYNGLGKKQKALDWLERGVEEHTFQILTLKTFPGWANLRDEPRFHVLLRRMRLE
jgi:DNA-binding winged helix-turn-helix (wHTH) protein/TolB-like protein/Flp pilus assembly protein TadD